MILSASRRTDIPCYYAEWLLNRLRAGYALTRNPMNPAQISRVPLSPEVVDCIVFWTKDAKNLLPYLDELDRMGYMYYFQFTLTPYGRGLETNLRDKADIENTFIALSEKIGPERVLWRYDPIILNDELTPDYHRREFSRLCERLSPYTRRVTISFVDIYAKLLNRPAVKENLIRAVSPGEIASLSEFIGKTARAFGLYPCACCENADLSAYGIERASCVDGLLIEKLCGRPLDLPPDKNQRPGCGCAESVDIGAYDTCLNGCVYCYANNGEAAALRRHTAHDPCGELLFGSVSGERIVERKVSSNKQRRI